MILYLKIELRILHFSNQVRENSSWNWIEIVIFPSKSDLNSSLTLIEN